jgi:hypothetical protein
MYRESGDRPEYYQQIFVRSHGLFAPFTVRAALAFFTLVAGDHPDQAIGWSI